MKRKSDLVSSVGSVAGGEAEIPSVALPSDPVGPASHREPAPAAPTRNRERTAPRLAEAIPAELRDGTWVYIVSRPVKFPTPCVATAGSSPPRSAACDAADGPFSPACPHQRWFPVFSRVEIRSRGGAMTAICQEGRKPGGAPCREQGKMAAEGKEGLCSHVGAALAHINGTWKDPRKGEEMEMRHGKPQRNRKWAMRLGSLEYVGFFPARPPSPPRCPCCREKWTVEAATEAQSAKWAKDRGVSDPPALWSCRGPVCSRNGKPWVFAAGTEERPSGNVRDGAPVRSGYRFG